MIGPGEIAGLAEFYDRYANAFERTSPQSGCKLAASFTPGSRCYMNARDKA